MTDPAEKPLDEMLRAFLLEREKEKEDGLTNESVMAAVKRIAENQGIHEQADEKRHDEVMNRVKGVEARVTQLEGSADEAKKFQDSVDTDLDAVEQTVAAVKNAAEVKIAAVEATLAAEIQKREDAVRAQEAAEKAALKAQLATYAANEVADVLEKKNRWGKVKTALAVFAATSAASGLLYLLQHAAAR